MQQTKSRYNKKYYSRKELMLVKLVVGIVVIVGFIVYQFILVIVK